MNLCLKQGVITHLLQEHAELHIFVLPRSVAGLPKQYAEGPGLVKLTIGLNLPRPIRAFTVDEHGIAGGFSFGGIISNVTIPWGALGAVTPSLADFILSWPMEMKPAELEDEPARPALRVVK